MSTGEWLSAPSRAVRRLLAHRLAPAVGTALVGVTACVPAVLDDRPGVRALAGAGFATVLVAVGSGWRLLGLVAVLVPAAAVLATAVEPGRDRDVRAGLLVACAGLLVVLVAGLDRSERPARSARVTSAPLPGARGSALAVVLGVIAAGGVAAVSAGPPVPSVTLVLVGLAAAVSALVLATRPR